MMEERDERESLKRVMREPGRGGGGEVMKQERVRSSTVIDPWSTRGLTQATLIVLHWQQVGIVIGIKFYFILIPT